MAAHVIRQETPEDRIAIREVNIRAFGTPQEADLIDALRKDANPFVSLVACGDGDNGDVVGHICFSPVNIDAAPSVRAFGLGPMAVLPERQNTGIGSRLVRAGLDECRRCGADVVVVVGHPGYYPRFGFIPAHRLGLRCLYPVPDNAFMAVELTPGCLAGASGLVRYHAAFDQVA